MSAVPVGFRFHPTEEELINYYLKNKIHGSNFDNVIPEIDICKCEPWDLPAFSPIKSDDEEWFYFSQPDYKFINNRSRANRATDRGFWKITGREGEIKARETKAVIGKKRILTFHKGKVRSCQKTSWVIHEYYIPENLLPNAARQRDFVLCRLKKKDENTDIGACNEGEPNTNNRSGFENLTALLDTPDEGERCANNAYGFEDLLHIALQDTRTEEILGSLFTAPVSPQSHDYFSSVLRDDIIRANVGNDNHNELQFEFGVDEPENEEYSNPFVRDEDEYILEERSHATLNHSSEPKSLSKVYFEEVHQQDKSSPVASRLLQKNASDAKVASNIPRNIDRVQSLTDETDYEASEVLQAGFGHAHSMTLVTDKSSLNESRSRNGDMVRTNQPEVQTGQAHALMTVIAQSSYRGQRKQEFKPKELMYTSKLADKPKTPPRKSPEKPKKIFVLQSGRCTNNASGFGDLLYTSKLADKPKTPPRKSPEKPKESPRSDEKPKEPPRSDEQKVMKQKQTIGDWKDSFIEWKDSPLILKSHPPVVYTRNLVGGLILLMFFVGEFFSYGNWC